jgi:hypothetical protein
MANSDHGIIKDNKAEDQPKDKQRAQAVHSTGSDKSVSREATRDPGADDAGRTSGHEKRRP